MISQQFALRRKLMVQAGLPPRKGTLDDYTWAEIDAISQAGKGPDCFSVGDCKAVHIQGTVGTLEVDDTFCVYILGFDHNGATNTIDFGTFKTVSDGIDVCLVDSSYNTTTSTTRMFTINKSQTKSGGWGNSHMRKTVLGSDSSPASPTAKTLLAALPGDLRAVMKPMTIYTDNTGNQESAAEDVTPTVDYLPLLAEFEIFGNRVNANTAEQNYQKQYAYYSAGNSGVKYRHSAIDSAVFWWERSPQHFDSRYWCAAAGTGGAGKRIANVSLGLSPIFRV